MSNPSSRGILFTIMAVAAFMVGCGGLFEEGAEPRMATGPSQEEQALQEQEDYQEGAVDTSEVAYDDTDPSALTAFRAELDPYGAWVEDPVYGIVWIPNATVVGADFAPYVSAGHWGYSEQGDWLWESDYSWGWSTFHYGRWVWIPARGWSWIPGRRYAPAWVVWRVGDPGYDYVGWAPMPPYYYWSGGVAVGLWIVPPTPYVFCSSSHVFHRNVHEHIVGSGQVSGVASHSTVYAPSRPGMGGPARGYNPAQPTKGPPLSVAHVPASAAPHAFAKPQAKAISAATPAGHLPSGALGVRTSRSVSMRGHSQSLAARGPGASPMSRPVYRGVPAQLQPRPGQAARNMPSSPYYGPTNRASSPSTFRPAGTSFAPSAGSHRSPSGFSPSSPSSGFNPGGFRPSTPSSGFNPGSIRPSTPSSGFNPGGFHPSAPSGGGFRPSTPSGGGFHPSSGGGGFHPSSKPSSGGSHGGGRPSRR